MKANILLIFPDKDLLNNILNNIPELKIKTFATQEMLYY